MLGWDRSRLSHQLSRMEERGLLVHRRLGNGVAIDITRNGQNLVGQARPIHADAVRRRLIEPQGPNGYATLSGHTPTAHRFQQHRIAAPRPDHPETTRIPGL
ncbi:hypothetical protein [Mycobacterium sp. pUA109]|uniref:hypothetical protein n=1 Tax=Mycobacterium sp. pUA109 TaxID=3238982 RepID=UPI00351B509C